jgi:cysteine-rich repeat protein
MRLALTFGLGLLVGGILPSLARASEGAALVRCQRKIAAAAGRFVTLRRHAFERCVAQALRCPASLTASTTWADDPCLATAARQCRAKLARLGQAESRLAQSGPECTEAVGKRHAVPVDGFFDEDGLAFELMPLFCPTVAVREGEPADASLCQGVALRCTADAAVGAAAPRAAELLGRLGIPLVHDAPCLAARLCGNQELDGDEECDDGAANSDTEPDACRTSCLEAFCGDGVIDEDEDCDDGNPHDGDGCDADCFVEEGACGNRIVDEDEECDDGNQRDGDGCDADCLVEEGECGDGVVGEDEDCDDGNRRRGDGCDPDCVFEDECGDGDVGEDEECDDGALNSDTVPDRCRTDCTEPRCGDGVIDEDEECELPGTLLCTADCTLRLPGPLSSLAQLRGKGIESCQEAMLASSARVSARSRSLVQRCVLRVTRCVLGIPEAADPDGARADRCLARATAQCAAAARARDRVRERAAHVAARSCEHGAPLAQLLDADGLAFSEAASSCPFAEARTPTVVDLATCVMQRVQCLAENSVARAIPRANELLWELDLDPDEVFSCVTDPADLED